MEFAAVTFEVEVFGEEPARRTLLPGDLIGRSARAELCLEAEGLSEYAASVSLRAEPGGVCLKLLALRGGMWLDGSMEQAEEAVLAPGVAVWLGTARLAVAEVVIAEGVAGMAVPPTRKPGRRPRLELDRARDRAVATHGGRRCELVRKHFEIVRDLYATDEPMRAEEVARPLWGEGWKESWYVAVRRIRARLIQERLPDNLLKTSGQDQWSLNLQDWEVVEV